MLWPGEAGQPYDLWRRFVIECKVLRDSDRRSLEATIERGMEQTLGYMAKCSAEEGHLVVFDRREPSAGEREGPAPRMEEPSARGARGGLPPRMEEPSARGARGGLPPRMEEPSAGEHLGEDFERDGRRVTVWTL